MTGWKIRLYHARFCVSLTFTKPLIRSKHLKIFRKGYFSVLTFQPIIQIHRRGKFIFMITFLIPALWISKILLYIFSILKKWLTFISSSAPCLSCWGTMMTHFFRVALWRHLNIFFMRIQKKEYYKTCFHQNLCPPPHKKNWRENIICLFMLRRAYLSP